MSPCKVTLLVAVLLSCALVHASSPGYGVAGSEHHQRQAEVQATLAIPTQSAHYETPFATPTLAVDDPSEEPLLILPQDRILNSNGTTENAPPPRMLVMGYYPDWVGEEFPPNKIDFKRFDWIDFAFAVPNADYTLSWDDPESSPTLLSQLVSTAHSQGSKVKLSIGGWTGSKYFSPAVASGDSRKTFVDNILLTYMAYGLDGIDIDWEYPGREGSAGNKFGPDDTANFLLFLQTLRTTLPPEARITAAVEPTPFVDSNGRAMDDLTEFAEVLDWVLIMNYDLWGTSSHPGPNAPLYDSCGNSTQPDASAVGSFNAWTKAKFPASKLVLGLPSYGYISSSTAKRLRTRSKPKKKQRLHSKSLKVVSGDGDSDGQVQFRDLVAQGALLPTNATTQYTSGGGFERLWDICSSTPYLRSSSSDQVITYDDPISLGMKAAFAKQVGMLGVNIFDVHGDTDDWNLMDAVRKSMGIL
jgi:chitinase